MNLKTEKSQQSLVFPDVHLNHITPHKQILLAKGLDEEQTQGYFGEAEETPSHLFSFNFLLLWRRAVLRSDQAVILSELCTALTCPAGSSPLGQKSGKSVCTRGMCGAKALLTCSERGEKKPYNWKNTFDESIQIFY